MLGALSRTQTAPDAVVHDHGALVDRGVPGWRGLLTAAVLSIALGAGLYEGLPGGRSPVSSAARSHKGFSQKGLLSLPLAAQGPVAAALGADSPAYRVRANGGGFRAASPEQHLSATFTGSGVSVASGATRVGLSLRGVGYGSSLTAVGAVAPRARANHVLYAHPGLSEWYANGPLGIEQGFTLTHAPAGRSARALTLSLALSGNAQPTLARGGQAIRLTRAGKSVLRYTGLTATDARGHQLHSWLQLQGVRVLLHVDTTAARYPLRIDPFIQQGSKLTAKPGTEIGAGEFGVSVALSTDGNTAVIGGAFDNDTGGSGVGAAWVFTRSCGVWTQQEKLTASPGTEIGGLFGQSVALSSDGNTAVIGGHQDNRQVGAAWVFTRPSFGSAYAQQEKLTASPGTEIGGGAFGVSVALSSDGNTALIGGWGDNATGGSSYVGAAWVFTRPSFGSIYTQQEKLTASPGTEIGGGEFGLGVAVSSDGNTALIGGIGDNSVVGAAWVFTRPSFGSVYTQQQRLVADPGTESGAGEFGISVALSADGNTALIGGFRDDGGVGAGWVFTRPSVGSVYTQQEKLIAKPGTESGAGEFGTSVALSADGSTALVGGYGDDGYVGAAWVLTRPRFGGAYTQQEKLTGGTESGTGGFGRSVALSSDGSTALIGGYGDNGGAGAAWVFSNSPAQPHWYSNGKRIAGCVAEPVATKGTLTFLYVAPEAKTESAFHCKVTDKEVIENPAGGGAGIDQLTEFVLSGCKGKPSPCPKRTKLEVIAHMLPWATHLIPGPPIRDVVEGIELEVKCSDGTVLDTLTGELMPRVGNSVLEFDAGSGELMGPGGSKMTVAGTDKLKGPIRDRKITAESP